MSLRIFPSPSPTLPDAGSILLRGRALPSSAPLHLCLSHLAALPKGRAVLITPSKDLLSQALSNLQADADVRYAARRIHMFYPPTIAHLKLCVGMLRPFRGDDVSEVTNKLVLDTPPTLIVIQNLSAFFTPPLSDAPKSLSTYLSVVVEVLQLSRAMTAASSGRFCTSVLFVDQGLDQLKLPLVLPAGHTHLPDSSNDDEDLAVPLATTDVYRVAERYFEWSGLVSDIFTEVDVEARRNKRLELRSTQRGTILSGQTESSLTWLWQEERNMQGEIQYTWLDPRPPPVISIV